MNRFSPEARRQAQAAAEAEGRTEARQDLDRLIAEAGGDKGAVLDVAAREVQRLVTAGLRDPQKAARGNELSNLIRDFVEGRYESASTDAEDAEDGESTAMAA